MFRPLVMLAIALAASFSALADTHIHGIVRDSASRTPLPGATVRVDGTTLGAIAARDGVFHLHDVPVGRRRLVISMVGYTPRTVDVDPSSDARIEVLLVSTDVRSRDVTVEADRLQAGAPTQSVRLLTQAEVDEHRGQTFADVLKQIPGVSVMQTGPSIAKPMIHGMTGTRLVLLNSGIAQEGQQWGAEHAPEIDPFTQARIGVVRGPATILYGANAMGGVISLEPRPISTVDDLVGEVMVSGFLNNRQGAVSAVGEHGNIMGLPIAMRLQLSGRRAGDASTPDYVLRNTGFEEEAMALDLALPIDDWMITMNASGFSTVLGIYQGAHMGNAADLQRAIERGGPSTFSEFSYDIKNPRQEVGHFLMAVHVDGRLGAADALRLTYGWQQNLRKEFDAHNTRIVGRGDDPVERAIDSIARLKKALLTPAMELLLTTYNAELRWEHVFADAWRMTSGVSGVRQVNDRTGSVYLVPDYSSLGMGAYALHTLMIGTVTLSAGVRYDVRWLEADVRDRRSSTTIQQQRTFSNVAGSLGATWMPTDAWALSLNVGSGWRPPSVNELYSNDVHHGVALYEVGDSLLAPERNIAADVTVRYAVKGLDVEVSGYAHRFADYIFSLPDPLRPTVTVRGTFPTYRFTQHDAVIAGADVRAVVAIDDVWSLDVSATVVRGSDVERDVPLFMMPADRGRLGVHMHLPDVLGVHDGFIDVGMTGVRRQDRFVVDEDYVDPPAGYALADASIGGTFHFDHVDVRFSVTGTNLLDRRYRDYLSRFRYVAIDAGRDIILRINIPFNH